MMDSKSDYQWSDYSSLRKTNTDKSSMSGFSMYSSHQSTEGQSSSGVSSSLTGLSAKKEKKKKAIKRCLEELKQLVPPSQKGAKTGTVSTLQTVIQHMKKIKDAEDGQKGAGVDTELMGASQGEEFANMSYPGLAMDQAKSTTGDVLRIVMSVKECLVLQVSTELTDMVGYPKNYWFNQSLLDYVYKRDVVTLSSNLSHCKVHTKQAQASAEGKKEDDSEEGDKQKTMFFFRLRHFKSLRQSFSLSRADKYSVFCGQVQLQKVDLEFPPGTPAEGLQSDNMYMVLECTPVTTGYPGKGLLPEQSSFSTRHTIYCNYNFIHPTAIMLLGYLPQDMVGSSVFDYYHPDDLSLIYSIYQEVVKNPGKTFKSAPYRLRCKNSEYITVETEWSSFLNPWSKRLDFIMGQHQVITGPDNIEVFSEPPYSSKRLQVAPDVKVLIRRIKQLLHQSAATDTPEPSATITKEEQQPEMSTKEERKKSVTETPGPSGMGPPPELPTKENPMEGMGSGSPTYTGGTVSSNLTLASEEKVLIYNRLNYAQSILRYLTSQSHLDGEEECDEISPKDNITLDECSSSDGEGLAMDVDLPIKPPSFASSTKALVSEQEQREEMPPSPSHEDVPEEHTSQREPTVDDVYQPVSLTEEALKVHNIIEMQGYIKKMVREKEGVLTADGRFKGMFIGTKGRKKRLISTIDDAAHVTKYFRKGDGKALAVQGSRQRASAAQGTATSHLLSPPFPITKMEGEAAHITPSPAVMHPLPNMPNVPRFLQPTHPGMAPPRPKPPTTVPGLPTQALAGSSLTSPVLQEQLDVLNAQQSYLTGTTASLGFYSTPQVTQVTMTPNVFTRVPTVPPSQTPTPAPQSHTLTGLRWPYFHPQTGVRFLHQFFYHPFATQSQVVTQSLPPRFQVTDHSAKVMAAQPGGIRQNQDKIPKEMETQEENLETRKCKNEDQKGASRGNFEGSDSASGEDTTSSLLFLLDSTGSQNNSCNSETENYEINEKKKLPPEPPWLQGVKWDADVELRNKLSHKRWEAKRVLKNDRAHLSMLKSHDQVADQMEELLEHLQEQTSSWLLDEEADLLFTMECPLGSYTDDDSSIAKDTQSELDGKNREKSQLDPVALLGHNFTDEEQGAKERLEAVDEEVEEHMKNQEQADTDKTPTLLVENVEATSPKSDNSDKVSENSSENSLKDGTKKPESLEKMSTDSEISDDGSKVSSNLTPSDQRSHEEARSSLKESDNASLESSSSKDQRLVSSDSETEGSLPRSTLLQLFAKLKVEYDYSLQPEPPWIQQANFSPLVQLQYQQPMQDRVEVINKDKRALHSLGQPLVVNAQLTELVAEVTNVAVEEMETGKDITRTAVPSQHASSSGIGSMITGHGGSSSEATLVQRSSDSEEGRRQIIKGESREVPSDEYMSSVSTKRYPKDPSGSDENMSSVSAQQPKRDASPMDEVTTSDGSKMEEVVSSDGCKMEEVVSSDGCKMEVKESVAESAVSPSSSGGKPVDEATSSTSSTGGVRGVVSSKSVAFPGGVGKARTKGGRTKGVAKVGGGAKGSVSGGSSGRDSDDNKNGCSSSTVSGDSSVSQAWGYSMKESLRKAIRSSFLDTGSTGSAQGSSVFHGNNRTEGKMAGSSDLSSSEELSGDPGPSAVQFVSYLFVKEDEELSMPDEQE